MKSMIIIHDVSSHYHDYGDTMNDDFFGDNGFDWAAYQKDTWLNDKSGDD
jgi:hypothetical protein